MILGLSNTNFYVVFTAPYEHFELNKVYRVLTRYEPMVKEALVQADDGYNYFVPKKFLRNATKTEQVLYTTKE